MIPPRPRAGVLVRDLLQPNSHMKHASRVLAAVIFDMDGVVTDTARLHARAWKTLFDEYLQARARERHEAFAPFDAGADYLSYVDGKPRYDGVRSFLRARGIELPEGEVADGPQAQTVCGLGNAKDAIFQRLLYQERPTVFESTMVLARALRAEKVRLGLVTSSRHGREVLRLAGIEQLFDVVVDGLVADELELKGKPNPDIFLKAAELLAIAPARSAVVEDAVSGVQAGKRGGFGLVIGINRTNLGATLAANGADVVVRDLEGVDPGQIDHWLRARLPSALDRTEEIAARLRGRRPAVFLDYDGTLTPIVARPDLAIMDESMRAVVRALAYSCPTAIVSGRALQDVTRLVGLPELYYAGNHGFEIGGPAHSTIQYEPGKQFIADVQLASERLGRALAGVDGALIEDKRYSASVHYRLVAAERVPEVERVVDQVLQDLPSLHKRHGKKVFEIRPRIDWDKGRAVLWLLHVLHLDTPTVVPIYLGDDTTDEDAFSALKGRGIGVLVTAEPRSSAADYSLRDNQEVRRFLEVLTELARASSPP